MTWLGRSVSVFWLYPVLFFAAICLLPWWRTKSGNQIPLAAAYVNNFGRWEYVLLGHVAVTAALSLAAIGIHLVIQQLEKRK
jgi:hypothetical protein